MHGRNSACSIFDWGYFIKCFLCKFNQELWNFIRDKNKRKVLNLTNEPRRRKIKKHKTKINQRTRNYFWILFLSQKDLPQSCKTSPRVERLTKWRTIGRSRTPASGKEEDALIWYNNQLNSYPSYSDSTQLVFK